MRQKSFIIKSVRTSSNLMLAMVDPPIQNTSTQAQEGSIRRRASWPGRILRTELDKQNSFKKNATDFFLDKQNFRKIFAMCYSDHVFVQT